MTVPLYNLTDTWTSAGLDAILMSITTGGNAGNAFRLNVDSNDRFTVDSSQITEIKKSTTPQIARIYNTFTNTSNYERLTFDWTTQSSIITIATEAAGSGSQRSIIINGLQVLIQATASNIAKIGNNFLDLGASTLAFSTLGIGGFDTSLTAAAKDVIQFGDGSANANGWYQWAGMTRVASDVANTGTTLATVTGLSVNVQAGRTYHFDAYLSFTDAAAGGIKAAIAGTATATAIEYDGFIIDSGSNGVKGNAQATALATTVASSTTTGTAGIVIIKGTITVNAAGTLLVQHAQNTSNGTATTVKRGSTFMVYDMP
jgi:hypothetical protein